MLLPSSCLSRWYQYTFFPSGTTTTCITGGGTNLNKQPGAPHSLSSLTLPGTGGSETCGELQRRCCTSLVHVLTNNCEIHSEESRRLEADQDEALRRLPDDWILVAAIDNAGKQQEVC